MEEIWKRMYDKAKQVQKPREISKRVFAGSVAASIESSSGKIYIGVSVDTSCSLGICAERNAILNMITSGENEVKRVLAILPNGKVGAPCGACRELLVQLMPDKYKDIEIIVDYEKGKIVKLGELTPSWWL